MILVILSFLRGMDMALIRCTTPTIIFTFREVTISEIEYAYLRIKQNNEDIIERDLNTATTGADFISWKLTQAETLGLSPYFKAKIYCDWILADGTRGRSNVLSECVENSGVNEVMPDEGEDEE